MGRAFQAAKQRLNDSRIGGRKGVIPEVIWPHPTHLLTGKGLRLPRDPVAEMHHEAQLLVAVGVINGDQFSAHRHRNAQLLLQLAGDAGFDRFALLLFATGELPHPPQQAFLQALVNQHLPGRVEHDPHTDHLEGQRLGGIGHGPAARVAGSVSSAVGLPGAAVAVRPDCHRCPWQTHCAAYAAGDPRRWPVTDAPKPLPFQVIGVGVVLNAAGEVLIDQRLEEGLLGGMWEFPGGKQEQGETIETCIARELKEELGIAVTVGAELITVDHAYSHKKLRFVVHLCDWVSGEPQPLASQQVRWVRPDDLGNYAFPAANARIIEALLGSLESSAHP